MLQNPTGTCSSFISSWKRFVMASLVEGKLLRESLMMSMLCKNVGEVEGIERQIMSMVNRFERVSDERRVGEVESLGRRSGRRSWGKEVRTRRLRSLGGVRGWLRMVEVLRRDWEWRVYLRSWRGVVWRLVQQPSMRDYIQFWSSTLATAERDLGTILIE